MKPGVGIDVGFLEDLPLFPENAPSQLREKVIRELGLIAEQAIEIWPTSSGVLYGSLSFGEGKWREVNGMITILSDYDIYLILDNPIDYLKALKDKNKLMKAITNRISGSVSITFSWSTLIKLKMVSMQGKVIWGDERLNRYIEKTKPPPPINNLRLGYLFLIRAIANERERRTFLESAIIRGFWSYLLSTDEFNDMWQNIFSLRWNIEIIERDSFLDSNTKLIVRETIERKLNSKENNTSYKDEQLLDTAKFLLNCSYNKANICFRVKDYIHYTHYKISKRSLRKLLINFTKKRLRLYKTLVDITGSDFKISDMSRVRFIAQEAESMLSMEPRSCFLNDRELVQYCSKLMVDLGDLYIHKVRGYISNE